MEGRWTTMSDVPSSFFPPPYFSAPFRDKHNYITRATNASLSLSLARSPSFAHLSSNISFMSGLSFHRRLAQDTRGNFLSLCDVTVNSPSSTMKDRSSFHDYRTLLMVIFVASPGGYTLQ